MCEPFVSFSNEEIKEAERLGDTAKCPGCGETHEVKDSVDVTDGSKGMLQYVICGDKEYMLEIRGGKVF